MQIQSPSLFRAKPSAEASVTDCHLKHHEHISVNDPDSKLADAAAYLIIHNYKNI